MTGNVDWFLQRYPQLFHIAEAAAEASILKLGLLSTSAILDHYGIEGVARDTIEARHRAESIALPDSHRPEMVIRDQHPLVESQLVLRKISLDNWYRLLSSKVYFWPTRRRAEQMRVAYANSIVFVVDTAKLFRRHQGSLTLCPFNSGSTARGQTERGPHLFYAPDRYPITERRRVTGGWSRAVAEVAVEHSVPDVADCLVEVLT